MDRSRYAICWAVLQGAINAARCNPTPARPGRPMAGGGERGPGTGMSGPGSGACAVLSRTPFRRQQKGESREGSQPARPDRPDRIDFAGFFFFFFF